MIIGFIAGFISRVLYIRSARSHYPGYPSGYISQIALALIAALIGSSIIVALVAKQLTAATFLTLAATQFRDVRNTERMTLEKEEQLLLVGRGPGYIEGIAITFEARNYLAMLVALGTSVVTQYTGWIGGIIAAIILVLLGEKFMSGPELGELIDIKPVEVTFKKGSLLYVGPVMMMEVGLPGSRERFLREALAVTLTPKNPRGAAALWNISQRQALSHQVASTIGVQKDVGYPEQTPLCRMDMPNGNGTAGFVIIPVEHNMDQLIAAIQSTPVLESGKWSKMKSPILLNHRTSDDNEDQEHDTHSNTQEDQQGGNTSHG